ncbi:hypothetical protein Fcan01_07629 [Folsomia candida]|uniref:Uncharacterized protein n=1 Tax=Folsomia candida TaxID=158441 RepID=A0A226EJR1_FOLCA|nr:hypothetical protein Fcan01_07629 [Folsomia candida]
MGFVSKLIIQLFRRPVMTSAQMHPLFAAFAAAGGNANMLAGGSMSSSSTSSSAMSTSSLTISAAPSSSSSGNNHPGNSANPLTSPRHSPTGFGGLERLGPLGSGLSVTITPAAATPNLSLPPSTSSSSPSSSMPTNANAALATLAMALQNAQNHNQHQNHHDMSSPPDSPSHSMLGSPPPSPTPSELKDFKDAKDIKPISNSNPMSIPISLPMAMSLSAAAGAQFTSANNQASNSMAMAAQQQQLRALASSLQTAIAAAAQQQQQQNSANLMGKMMELASPMESDMVMSELTQRLIKMNQEIWQQGLASVAAAASSSQQTHSSNTSSPPPRPSSQVSGGHGASNSGGHVGGAGQTHRSSPIPSSSSHHGGTSNSSAAATVAALNALTAGQQQVNEIKLAEKLVSELAVQLYYIVLLQTMFHTWGLIKIESLIFPAAEVHTTTIPSAAMERNPGVVKGGKIYGTFGESRSSQLLTLAFTSRSILPLAVLSIQKHGLWSELRKRESGRSLREDLEERAVCSGESLTFSTKPGFSLRKVEPAFSRRLRTTRSSTNSRLTDSPRKGMTTFVSKFKIQDLIYTSSVSNSIISL